MEKQKKDGAKQQAETVEMAKNIQALKSMSFNMEEQKQNDVTADKPAVDSALPAVASAKPKFENSEPPAELTERDQDTKLEQNQPDAGFDATITPI